MKIRSSFLFLFTTSSVLGFNWQSGAHNVMWAQGCDFWGSDSIPSVPNAPAEKCGDYCALNLQCTHFTWWMGTCYLKHFDSLATAWPSEGAVCGWVVSFETIVTSSYQNLLIRDI